MPVKKKAIKKPFPAGSFAFDADSPSLGVRRKKDGGSTKDSEIINNKTRKSKRRITAKKVTVARIKTVKKATGPKRKK